MIRSDSVFRCREALNSNVMIYYCASIQAVLNSKSFSNHAFYYDIEIEDTRFQCSINLCCESHRLLLLRHRFDSPATDRCHRMYCMSCWIVLQLIRCSCRHVANCPCHFQTMSAFVTWEHGIHDVSASSYAHFLTVYAINLNLFRGYLVSSIFDR